MLYRKISFHLERLYRGNAHAKFCEQIASFIYVSYAVVGRHYATCRQLLQEHRVFHTSKGEVMSELAGLFGGARKATTNTRRLGVAILTQMLTFWHHLQHHRKI